METLYPETVGDRKLSQIQEHASTTATQPRTLKREKEMEEREEEKRGGGEEAGMQADLASLPLYEQQRKLEENRSLLQELAHIEADLRESLRMEVDREREREFLRQQDNRMNRQHLCYLRLSQRVNKSWVSSYFRSFPMHIYCLPIQTISHAPKNNVRRGKKKR